MKSKSCRQILCKGGARLIAGSILMTVFLLALVANRARAGEPIKNVFAGSVYGTVTDAQTGDPLTGANILLQGTNKGASVDVNGKYEIAGVEPGTYILVARFIGYRDFRREVEIEDNQALEIN